MINSQYLDEISKAVTNNSMNEAVGTGDMVGGASLIYPLVKKLFSETLLSQIADIQPMSGPVGKICALHTYYKGTADTTLFGSVVLDLGSVTVGGGAVPAVGDKIYKTAAQTDQIGTITYVEGTGSNTMVLMERTVADTDKLDYDSDRYVAFTSPGALHYGTTDSEFYVRRTIQNRTTVKRVLSNFGGNVSQNRAYTYAEHLDELGPRQIKSEVRSMTVEALTRKLFTSFSLEQLTDLQKLYNEDYNKIAADILGNEIRQEIDISVISFLKTIAKNTRTTPIDVSKSIGKSNDIQSISNDVFINIFFAVEQIVRATKRDRNMFVLADAATIALLATNPLNVQIKKDNKNDPFHVGYIGGIYPLYLDPYTDPYNWGSAGAKADNYLIVGYKGQEKGIGDAGIIYTPYTESIVKAKDADTFEEKIAIVSRYNVVQHPQDQSAGNGDSDFFRKIEIQGIDNVSTDFAFDILNDFTKNY